MTFKTLCEALEKEIQESYTTGITLEAAEKLAGQFLHAQMTASNELRKADLDSRMRKTGVKAMRAGMYADIVGKSDKKPTEAAIENEIVRNPVVQAEQDRLDDAEVTRDDIERYYNIFQQAHVHFRQLAKGGFNG